MLRSQPLPHPRPEYDCYAGYCSYVRNGATKYARQIARKQRFYKDLYKLVNFPFCTFHERNQNTIASDATYLAKLTVSPLI